MVQDFVAVIKDLTEVSHNAVTSQVQSEQVVIVVTFHRVRCTSKTQFPKRQRQGVQNRVRLVLVSYPTKANEARPINKLLVLLKRT